jgi:hypothetical protein
VSGIVERETAKDMIFRYSPGAMRITVGADKGFDRPISWLTCGPIRSGLLPISASD